MGFRGGASHRMGCASLGSHCLGGTVFCVIWSLWLGFALVSWFNPSCQLSTTQLLAHYSMLPIPAEIRTTGDRGEDIPSTSCRVGGSASLAVVIHGKKKFQRKIIISIYLFYFFSAWLLLDVMMFAYQRAGNGCLALSCTGSCLLCGQYLAETRAAFWKNT